MLCYAVLCCAKRTFNWLIYSSSHQLEDHTYITLRYITLQIVKLCIKVLPRVLHEEGVTDVLQSCLSHPLSKLEEAALSSSSSSSLYGNMHAPSHTQSHTHTHTHTQSQTQSTTEPVGASPPQNQYQYRVGERGSSTPSSSTTSSRALGAGLGLGQGGSSGVRVSGPPRIWHRAVKVAAGYEEYSLSSAASASTENVPEVNSNVVNRKNKIKGRKVIPPPPIVLFLMSDALHLMKDDLRAHPSAFKVPSNETSTIATGPLDCSSGTQTRDSTRKFNFNLSPKVSNRYMDFPDKDKEKEIEAEEHYIDEELHYTIYEHWLCFQTWGLNPHRYGTGMGSLSFPKKITVSSEFGSPQGPRSMGNSFNGSNKSFQKRLNGETSDAMQHFHFRVRKDPIYLVIQAAIMEYKICQIRLCEALTVTARHIALRTLSSSSPLDYPSIISAKVAYAALNNNGGQGQGQGLVPVSTKKVTRTVSDFESLHALYLGNHTNSCATNGRNSSSSDSSSSSNIGVGRGGGGVAERGEGDRECGSTLNKSPHLLQPISTSMSSSIDLSLAPPSRGGFIGISHNMDPSSKPYAHYTPATDARSRDLHDTVQSSLLKPTLPAASLSLSLFELVHTHIPLPDPVFLAVPCPLYAETPVQAAFDTSQVLPLPNVISAVELINVVAVTQTEREQAAVESKGCDDVQAMEDTTAMNLINVETKDEVKGETVNVETLKVEVKEGSKNKNEVDDAKDTHSTLALMMASTPASVRASLAAVSTAPYLRMLR